MFELLQWFFILALLGNKIFSTILPGELTNLKKDVEKLKEIHKGHPEL